MDYGIIALMMWQQKSAWGKDRAKVLDFYNERRHYLVLNQNDAHRALNGKTFRGYYCN
jgi:hypothetical protein